MPALLCALQVSSVTEMLELSDEAQEVFVFDTIAVGSAMALAVIGSLILGLAMVVAQMFESTRTAAKQEAKRVLEQAARGRMSHPPTVQPYPWTLLEGCKYMCIQHVENAIFGAAELAKLALLPDRCRFGLLSSLQRSHIAAWLSSRDETVLQRRPKVARFAPSNTSGASSRTTRWRRRATHAISPTCCAA